MTGWSLKDQSDQKGKGNMRYQAVIFDLDGVICHTDKFHYIAWKVIADELSIPFNRQLNDRMRGIDRMASLEVLLGERSKEFSPEMKESYARKKNKIYKDSLRKLSEADLNADVKVTLAGVRSAGLKMAIGSSSKNTRLILTQLGLETTFDAISDGTNIIRSKPDPEVFLKAAGMLHVDAEGCLVVEDAQSGIMAAKAAGMDSAAVGDAVNYGLANYKLEKLSDLLKII